MSRSGREYPERPLVGVGGVVISGGRALLVRRAGEPARGEWTIPGGLLEAGETLAEGVVRELREETGLTVRVLELIEALERIFVDESRVDETQRADALPQDRPAGRRPRPRYHYVILDYLCERIAGEPRANEEIAGLALVREDELDRYALTPAAERVLRKAFAMARSRGLP